MRECLLCHCETETLVCEACRAKKRSRALLGGARVVAEKLVVIAKGVIPEVVRRGPGRPRKNP